MEDDQVFEELQKLLDRLSVKIKYGRGYFKGGLCRYKDERYLYLNRADDTDRHISLILSEIENIDLNGIKVSKSIMELLSK